MSRFDAISFVETCYRLDLDQRSWLAELARAAHPSLNRGLGTIAVLYEATDRLQVVDVGAHECGYEPRPMVERISSTADSAVIAAMIGSGVRGAHTCRDFVEGGAPDAQPEHVYRNAGAPDFIEDHVAVFTPLTSPRIISLGGHSARRTRVTPQTAKLWRRLAWHAAAGLRLRDSGAASSNGEAVCDPSGNVLHAQGAARTAREALHRAVVRRERARSARAGQAEGIDLWQGLVSGRWSLVDRFERDGKRFVVAHSNPPEFRDPRALSQRERRSAVLAAQGRGNADIGYGLGIGESTVATHVAAALRKLGLSRREELASLLVGTLCAQDGPLAVSVEEGPLPLASLTPRENAVASLVLRGRSNDEIARELGSRPRTVMNQLQSIYRKLGVDSRARLAAYLARRARETTGSHRGLTA